MSTTLTPYLFMNAVTASGTFPSGGGYTIDPRYNEERLRSISGTRVDVNDAINVLLETEVKVFGQNGDLVSTVIVTATATTFSSANGTFNSCVIQGPFTRIKLHKTGSSGAATFVGWL